MTSLTIAVQFLVLIAMCLYSIGGSSSGTNHGTKPNEVEVGFGKLQAM
jgi:hypothetical protein